MTEHQYPPYAVQVFSTVNRVTTLRKGTWVVQNHRGYGVRIQFRGYRKPYYTLSFHQKQRAARLLGERVAKRIMRQGGPEALDERDWMSPSEIHREREAEERRRDAEERIRVTQERRAKREAWVSRPR